MNPDTSSGMVRVTPSHAHLGIELGVRLLAVGEYHGERIGFFAIAAVGPWTVLASHHHEDLVAVRKRLFEAPARNLQRAVLACVVGQPATVAALSHALLTVPTESLSDLVQATRCYHGEPQFAHAVVQPRGTDGWTVRQGNRYLPRTAAARPEAVRQWQLEKMVLVVADALFGQQGDGVIQRTKEGGILDTPIADQTQQLVAPVTVAVGVEQALAGLRPAGMRADQRTQQVRCGIRQFGHDPSRLMRDDRGSIARPNVLAEPWSAGKAAVE